MPGGARSKDIGGFNWFKAFLALLVLALVFASGWDSGFSLTSFLEPGNARNISRFLDGLWPPDLEAAFLASTWRLLVETIEISLVGTALALVFALPLSFAAMRLRGEEYLLRPQGKLSWAIRWFFYYLARFLLNLSRGIPELLWALIFVVAVGLGPFSGILALAAHSTGVLGKLYAEIFESVDQRLVEATRATGASEIQVLAYTRFSQSLPVFLSYTLFRWECNMRAATILGFVGAGGIGNQLIISMKLFRYGEVMTLVLAILLLVVLVDLAGQVIRALILDGPSHLGQQSSTDRRLLRHILKASRKDSL